MAAFVASFLGGQPLLISGVTGKPLYPNSQFSLTRLGPITVFNKTIYDIFEGRQDFNYLHFIGWVYLWGAIFHWVAALTNGKSQYAPSTCSITNLRGGWLIAVKFLKYVTRFSCDTFGFYVAAVWDSGCDEAVWTE
jgi:hypothetical protein